MAQKTWTHLKGCEVEISQEGIEGSWCGTITGAMVDLDVSYYELETSDGLKFLVPQMSIVWMRLVRGRKVFQANHKRKQKKARILTLVDS